MRFCIHLHAFLTKINAKCLMKSQNAYTNGMFIFSLCRAKLKKLTLKSIFFDFVS